MVSSIIRMSAQGPVLLASSRELILGQVFEDDARCAICFPVFGREVFFDTYSYRTYVQQQTEAAATRI